MRGILLAVAIFSVSPAALAIKVLPIHYVCPIGGERFTEMSAVSGMQTGMQSDFRPTGAIVAPWPMAECPGNGFVIYKDANAFTASEKRKLATYVAGEEYRSLVLAQESTYWRAAMLARRAGEPASTLAWMHVNATWQVGRDAQRYARYARAALQALAEVDDPRGAEERALLTVELLRRLGRFPEALVALGSMPPTQDPDVLRIAAYQRRLIEQRDHAPHSLR